MRSRSGALAVLEKLVVLTKLKKRPDIKAQILFDIGILHENAGNIEKAETTFQGAD